VSVPPFGLFLVMGDTRGIGSGTFRCSLPHGIPYIAFRRFKRSMRALRATAAARGTSAYTLAAPPRRANFPFGARRAKIPPTPANNPEEDRFVSSIPGL